MKINISDAIAVAAIIVSVLTAWTSLDSARNTAGTATVVRAPLLQAQRARPRQGHAPAGLTDSDRRLNSIVFAARAATREDLETLAQLDREAVDTFHAISHHLPTGTREAIDAMRTRLERSGCSTLRTSDQTRSFPWTRTPT